MNKKIILFWFFLIITIGLVDAQTIQILHNSQHCSIRGLSVLNNKIVWLSGSNGCVARSTNGGKTFRWQQISGFEKSDFRDIQGFSAKEAVVMSSGSPALILKTKDGGKIWKTVYKNNAQAYFFDAMDFDNRRHGLVLGDPVNGKFLLLETLDKGESWGKSNQQPTALPGEAAFAASGTCLLVSNHHRNKKEVNLVTGGSISRLATLSGDGNWIMTNLPIIHGAASQGAFSIANGAGFTVITGGDYLHNKNTEAVMCFQNISGRFGPPMQMPAGYQSCVAYIGHTTFLSTGTSGSNLSLDGGKTWKQIDSGSYNVCQRAKHGKLILLAGDAGKIGQLKTK